MKWMLSLLCLVACATTAAAATQPPTVSHIGSVAPDILALELQAGKRIPAQQQPYDGGVLDWIDDSRDRHRWIRRGKGVLGAVVGPAKDTLYPFDGFEGAPLDTRWADDPRSFTISSTDDPNYQRGINPGTIYRKSRPNDMARTGFWAFAWPMEHHLYLKLPTPLKEGSHYRISFNRSPLKAQEYRHNSLQTRSEAVHVSQIGFRPDDGDKVAFLSLWRGNGGGHYYPEGLPFKVIDNDSQQAVFTGRTRMARSQYEGEDAYEQNYTGADVYQMSFDSVTRAGNYRVCVEGVGCSLAFPISDSVWRDAFTTSARGLYHQRSGIALGPPHTRYQRPRNLHPDDGFVVYQSRTPLMDTQNGLNAKGTGQNNFNNLVQGKTNETVANAWGGYADAGDWDRRIQHLATTRLLLELVELNPAYFEKLALNIPESGNALPDLIDEALWGLDLFRRLQTPEGGVRGGIESTDHPRHGEGSWQESQTLLAYAPGLWSSYIYAGVAARAARVLQGHDSAQANSYQQSALKAMQWAEAAHSTHHYPSLPHQVNDDRNLAALEMFRLTQDPRWHRVFIDTSVFRQPGAPLQKWQSHDQSDAAFAYQLTKGADPLVQHNARQALIQEAEQSINSGQRTAFRWTKRNPWAWVGWGMLSVPQAGTLVRAHHLTGDTRYLSAIRLSTQFGAGANPLNMAFTTGIGQNFPQHPLIQDQRVSAQMPPEGITVNGPLETKRQLDFWLSKQMGELLFPAHADWPTAEAYFDIYDFAPMNEFTVHSTIAPNAYVWGYLAATNNK